jgi:hypothetical protein
MELTDLQTCRGPRQWPAAPVKLSVSSLLEIEECPRRWSLRNARYESIWAHNGYPPNTTPSALAGSTVHLALEWITIELVRAGCESAQSGTAVAVMRRLGGYTAIVEKAALKLVADLQENPRLATRIPLLKRSLLRRIPQLRERVQKVLSRLRLSQRTPATSPANPGDDRRRPLGLGSYAEVRLHAPRIGWRGTADLLTVTADGSEISDFKTGAASESHAFQLQVYALLWHRDSELNPHAKLALRLVVSYTNVDVDVPPLTAEGMHTFERLLVERSEGARQRLELRPPPATPAADVCAWCPVRHLCEEYWRPGTLRQISPLTEDGDRYEDLEIELLAPHGPGMWTAAVRGSSSLKEGSAVRVQVDAVHAALMRKGRVLRILGTRVIELVEFDADASATLIAPSMWTELFVVDPRPA